MARCDRRRTHRFYLAARCWFVIFTKNFDFDQKIIIWIFTKKIIRNFNFLSKLSIFDWPYFLIIYFYLDPETAGIMAWNRIFEIKSGDEDIAVLLLDTQGAFDDDSDVKDVTLIFSLSTMISR